MLDKRKHVNYWKRCLKSLLPKEYINLDSNRMMLGFFIISALDLLGALDNSIDPLERSGRIEWIYSCQHPKGGFQGFPYTVYKSGFSHCKSSLELAHIANTYFALASLAILGDDFKRVRKDECLKWLKRLQRADGSFGEQLDENFAPVGLMNVRFGYCASTILLMLKGSKSSPDAEKDLNVDKMIERVRSSMACTAHVLNV